MKKNFTVPLVFLTTAEPNEGGIGSNVGGGGGDLDSVRPLPLNFGEWAQSRYCEDLDGSGEPDFNDYALWWSNNGFGGEMWAEYNPGSDQG